MGRDRNPEQENKGEERRQGARESDFHVEAGAMKFF